MSHAQTVAHKWGRFSWAVVLYKQTFIHTETKAQAMQVAKDCRTYFPKHADELTLNQRMAGQAMRTHAAFAGAGDEFPTLAECEAAAIEREKQQNTCEFCDTVNGHVEGCPFYEDDAK